MLGEVFGLDLVLVLLVLIVGLVVPVWAQRAPVNDITTKDRLTRPLKSREAIRKP